MQRPGCRQILYFDLVKGRYVLPLDIKLEYNTEKEIFAHFGPELINIIRKNHVIKDNGIFIWSEFQEKEFFVSSGWTKFLDDSKPVNDNIVDRPRIVVHRDYIEPSDPYHDPKSIDTEIKPRSTEKQDSIVSKSDIRDIKIESKLEQLNRAFERDVVIQKENDQEEKAAAERATTISMLEDEISLFKFQMAMDGVSEQVVKQCEMSILNCQVLLAEALEANFASLTLSDSTMEKESSTKVVESLAKAIKSSRNLNCNS